MDNLQVINLLTLANLESYSFELNDKKRGATGCFWVDCISHLPFVVLMVPDDIKPRIACIQPVSYDKISLLINL